MLLIWQLFHMYLACALDVKLVGVAFSLNLFGTEDPVITCELSIERSQTRPAMCT